MGDREFPLYLRKRVAYTRIEFQARSHFLTVARMAVSSALNLIALIQGDHDGWEETSTEIFAQLPVKVVTEYSNAFCTCFKRAFCEHAGGNGAMDISLPRESATAQVNVGCRSIRSRTCSGHHSSNCQPTAHVVIETVIITHGIFRGTRLPDKDSMKLLTAQDALIRPHWSSETVFTTSRDLSTRRARISYYRIKDRLPHIL